jgi:hypothetical protein
MSNFVGQLAIGLLALPGCDGYGTMPAATLPVEGERVCSMPGTAHAYFIMPSTVKRSGGLFLCTLDANPVGNRLEER